MLYFIICGRVHGRTHAQKLTPVFTDVASSCHISLKNFQHFPKHILLSDLKLAPSGWLFILCLSTKTCMTCFSCLQTQLLLPSKQILKHLRSQHNYQTARIMCHVKQRQVTNSFIHFRLGEYFTGKILLIC